MVSLIHHKTRLCHRRPRSIDSRAAIYMLRAAIYTMYNILIDSTCNIYIDDEKASMLDVHLAAALFRALRPGCRLLLVGDPNQVEVL